LRTALQPTAGRAARACRRDHSGQLLAFSRQGFVVPARRALRTDASNRSGFQLAHWAGALEAAASQSADLGPTVPVATVIAMPLLTQAADALALCVASSFGSPWSTGLTMMRKC